MCHLQAHERDNGQLRRQLSDSQLQCASLCNRLEEVSLALEELLHQDQHGDVSPDRVNGLKQQLGETRSLLDLLSLTLEGKQQQNGLT